MVDNPQQWSRSGAWIRGAITALVISSAFFFVGLVILEQQSEEKSQEIAQSAIKVSDINCEQISTNQQKLVEVVNLQTAPIAISADTPPEARERIIKRNEDNVKAREAILPLLAPDLCMDGLPPTTPSTGTTTIPEGE